MCEPLILGHEGELDAPGDIVRAVLLGKILGEVPDDIDIFEGWLILLGFGRNYWFFWLAVGGALEDHFTFFEVYRLSGSLDDLISVVLDWKELGKLVNLEWYDVREHLVDELVKLASAKES